jgi:hypothetical protein
MMEKNYVMDVIGLILDKIKEETTECCYDDVDWEAVEYYTDLLKEFIKENVE